MNPAAPETNRLARQPGDAGPAGNVESFAALVAYDERLREGVTAVAREPGDDSATAAPPPELVECLEFIEQVWPRGGQHPPAANLPSHIGRFEIERLLGQGGFGIVYLARDPLLDRQVALKVPRLHALASEGMLERFRREARATAALDHPNIVPIHETGEAGPLCYIAFAYCEGPSLAQWLKLQASDVPPRMAVLVVRQLAEAMHYSHSRGVLHRDLKPSNVLLFPPAPGAPSESEREALPFVPRIVDFGLARLAEEELEATGTSAVIGTPLYMAPEQALGPPDAVGPAADLYALGVILYELLCRRPPFIGAAPLDVLDQVRSAEPASIRKQRPEVPRDLETICLKCLQKRPAERYASALELTDDLRRFLAGESIAARPVSTAARFYRWCQRPERPREAGWTVSAVNAVVGGSILLTALVSHLGFLPLPAPGGYAEIYLPPISICVTTHAPLVFIGWLMTRAIRWASIVSLISGMIMLAVAAGFIFGLMRPGVDPWTDIPGFRALFSVFALLFLLQVVVSAIALVAIARPKSPALARLS